MDVDQVSLDARRRRLLSGAVVVSTAVCVLFSALVGLGVITGRRILGGGLLNVTELPQAQGDASAGPTTVDVLGLGVRALCATPSLVTCAVAILVGLFTVRLVRLVAGRQPFSRPVRRSMHGLVVTLLGGGLMYGVLDTLAVVAIGEARGNGDEWSVMLSLPLGLSGSWRPGSSLPHSTQHFTRERGGPGSPRD